MHYGNSPKCQEWENKYGVFTGYKGEGKQDTICPVCNARIFFEAFRPPMEPRDSIIY